MSETTVELWTRKAIAEQSKLIRAVALEIGTDVIKNTRVDTGRARNSWIFTVDTSDESTVRESQKSGSQAFSNMRAEVGAMVGKTLFVTNNLPYIYFLEYGTSRRPGDAMVRKAVKRFRSLVNARS